MKAVASDITIVMYGSRVRIFGKDGMFTVDVSPVGAIKLWLKRRHWKDLLARVQLLAENMNCQVVVRVAGIPVYRLR